MATDLEALLVVQDHDTAADQLRHRRAALAERAAVATLEGERAAFGAEASERGAVRDALATRQAGLEATIDTDEGKRAGLERKLATVTVPREAQALADEIDGLKARQRTLEDELLEVMEEREPLDERLDALDAIETDLSSRLEVARAALAEQERAIDGELATVETERAAAVGGVPQSLVDRYERLRARLGGVAVARLDHGRCLGCNLSLSTLFLEQLRHEPPDALVECENCGRLLVR